MPKATIVIPTFSKAAAFFPITKASIDEQTFTDYEIMVDDREGPRLWQKSNDALDKVETEYMAFCHSDDIYLPEWLEKCVKYLDENPEVGLVGT